MRSHSRRRLYRARRLGDRTRLCREPSGPRHDLPDLPVEQLVACRCQQAAGASSLAAVDVAHVADAECCIRTSGRPTASSRSPTASRSPSSPARMPRSRSASTTPTRATVSAIRSGRTPSVEGGQWTTGDRHTIVVDRDTCRLYETWATRAIRHRAGRAGSGATLEPDKQFTPPANWTSADAAGPADPAGAAALR